MAYRGGFVVNIVKNGKVVDDENGTVALPFGCEYKLRLKNKNTRDAVAKVFIDGREATSAGDLIVHAGEDSEIERFIDSIKSGKKFKFVTVEGMSDSEKNDPNNGIVEVRFRLKREVTERVIYHEPPIVEEHHYYYPRTVRKIYHDYPSWNTTPYYGSFYNSGPKGSSMGNITLSNVNASCSASNAINFCSATNTCSNSSSFDISDVNTGKTVEGSHSSQSFGYSYIGELEEKETIIKLKLVGYDDTRIKPIMKHCSECGTLVEREAKFCVECGKNLK